MALLFNVFLVSGPHTVRGLAQCLNISKPAVSRALDRLGELGYIRRERDDLDRRNVLVQRMPKGAAFLHQYAGLVIEAEKEAAQIPEDKIADFILDAARDQMSDTAQALEDQPAVNWADVAA
jgi:DNA-binding MarR family transcriptional regulator